MPACWLACASCVPSIPPVEKKIENKRARSVQKYIQLLGYPTASFLKKLILVKIEDLKGSPESDIESKDLHNNVKPAHQINPGVLYKHICCRSTSLMMHTKSQGHWPLGSTETYSRVFTIFGHGGHFDQVTENKMSFLYWMSGFVSDQGIR